MSQEFEFLMYRMTDEDASVIHYKKMSNGACKAKASRYGLVIRFGRIFAFG